MKLEVKKDAAGRYFIGNVEKEETGPQPILPGFRAADIQRLQVLPRGQLAIYAERTNQSWRLTQPLAYPARSVAIDALLFVLERLASSTFIPMHEVTNLANADQQYGFDPPEFSLALGQPQFQLLVGRRTAFGDQVFVQRVGADGIFVVDARLLDLLPATVGRLSRVPRIVGIKEAVGETSRIRELVAVVTPGFEVLSGDDLTARDAIFNGAVGVISVTANVAPRAMADMVAAALKGDRAGATQIDQRLVALHRNLFVESNPIPVKWAVSRMGLSGGTIRLPLTELSAEYHAVVIESLFAAGISVK